MKDLIILGKAPISQSIQELKKENVEIWMCGTDTRSGGDVYFELHGIKVFHPLVYYKLPSEVYTKGLPINNSISAMLVYAWILGFKNIRVMGAPMLACDEYIEQRSALAYIVGFLNGKGLNVKWDSLPENINYGK